VVPAMAANRVFFGWKVVWVAFIIAIFGAGVGLYGPSVLLQALHASRGWAISTISAAITMHFLVSALIIIFLPELYRRISLATYTIVGVTSCGVGIVVWANALEPWQLFLGALFTGVGWASTSSAAINAIVSRWFDRERAKALSMALNGASVGGVFFAPLWVLLISHLGLPMAALIVASLMICVIWPLAIRFLRPVPADLGLTVDGLSKIDEHLQFAVPSLTRGELLRDKRFLTISAAFALGMFAQIGLLAHMIERLSLDYSPQGAAIVMSLITGCALIGRTIVGWSLGTGDRRLAAGVNFLIQATGVLLLGVGSGPIAVLTGCILFGLTGGNLLTLPPLIAQAEFEHVDVGKVVALAIAINQAVMAFGPAVFGILHDVTGSYVVPFALANILEVAAALILLAGRRRIPVTTASR
jgi:MFS family permease